MYGYTPAQINAIREHLRRIGVTRWPVTRAMAESLTYDSPRQMVDRVAASMGFVRPSDVLDNFDLSRAERQRVIVFLRSEAKEGPLKGIDIRDLPPAQRKAAVRKYGSGTLTNDPEEVEYLINQFAQQDYERRIVAAFESQERAAAAKARRQVQARERARERRRQPRQRAEANVKFSYELVPAESSEGRFDTTVRTNVSGATRLTKETRFVGTATLHFDRSRAKAPGSVYRESQTFTVDAVGALAAAAAVDGAINGELRKMDSDSVTHMVTPVSVDYNIGPFYPNGKLQDVRMRNAWHPQITDNMYKYSTERLGDWDTRRGRCVFDYLLKRYRTNRNKWMTEASLCEVFAQGYGGNVPDFLTEGVNTRDLVLLCRKLRTSLYAMNDNEKVFHVYRPADDGLEQDYNSPSLVYRIHGNHFYPIIDKASVHAAATCAILTKSDSVATRHAPKSTKEPSKAPAIVAAEGVKDTIEYIARIMAETETLPSKVRYSDGQVISFEISGNVHKVNQHVEATEIVCKSAEIQNTGQSMNTLLYQIVRKATGVDMPTSTLNPHMFDVLTAPRIKDKAHFGLYGAWNQTGFDPIKDIPAGSELLSYDIARCHTSVAMEPAEPFYIFTNVTEWVSCTPERRKVTPGLYWVETKEYRILFKGCGVYSAACINKAFDEGLDFVVTRAAMAETFFPEGLTRKIVDAVTEVIPCEDLQKSTLNSGWGTMGKHQSQKFSLGNLNSSYEQICAELSDIAKDPMKRLYIHQFSVKTPAGPVTHWLYGHSQDVLHTSNNVPAYIQILDQANMRLYDMVKAMGGFETLPDGRPKLVFLKTDCAVVIDGREPVYRDGYSGPGSYRVCNTPNIKYVPPHTCPVFVEPRDWETHESINDSDQWKEVMDIVDTHGGCLLTGRAGTGKSFIIQQIRKYVEAAGGKCMVMAPTHVASKNIGGRTIHGTLGLGFSTAAKETAIAEESAEPVPAGDSDEKPRTSTNCAITSVFAKLRRERTLVIVDEVSMLNSDMLTILSEMKRQTGCRFLLVGDDRQCGPIESNGLQSYFNHSSVKFIANFHLVELTTPKRYDMVMWELTSNVNDIKLSMFETCSQMGDRYYTAHHLCHLNQTRRVINAKVNNFWANMRRFNCTYELLASAHGDIDDEYAQDMYVYPGLPLMARVNERDEEDRDTYILTNGEMFRVSDIGVDADSGETIVDVMPEDADADTKPIQVPLTKLQAKFLMGYATTVHKVQGLTIDRDIVIHDWFSPSMDDRVKYTALTRVKSANRIHIETVRNDEAFTEYMFRDIILTKIKGHIREDVRKGLVTRAVAASSQYIDVKYIRDLWTQQSGVCALRCHDQCQGDMLMTARKKSQSQFTIDRKDNKLGHVKGNVQLACLRCNTMNPHERMSRVVTTAIAAVAQVTTPVEGQEPWDGDDEVYTEPIFVGAAPAAPPPQVDTPCSLVFEVDMKPLWDKRISTNDVCFSMRRFMFNHLESAFMKNNVKICRDPITNAIVDNDFICHRFEGRDVLQMVFPHMALPSAVAVQIAEAISSDTGFPVKVVVPVSTEYDTVLKREGTYMTWGFVSDHPANTWGPLHWEERVGAKAHFNKGW